MNLKLNLHYLLTSAVLLLFLSCHQKKECLPFSDEIYHEEQVDSNESAQAMIYRNLLLKRFNETAIDSQRFDSYHLLFYSSHGFGKSIKFERRNGAYFMGVKFILKKGIFEDGRDYNTQITKKEWDVFEHMIYDFNFWTANKFDVRRPMLDGYVYFLEGVRPEGKNCDKKEHQFIGRRSPEYDKMGALCEFICVYEEELSLSYNKTH